tara:strand:+ start:969 stop:1604 length:636 start_codon:yes stop_codon:yes gene_type:complete
MIKNSRFIMLHSLIFFLGLVLLVILSSIDIRINIIIFSFFIFLSLFIKVSFFKFISKIKYFILALLAIYSLSTPGEIIFYYSFISITKEGLDLAINNIFRIINTFLTVIFLMKIIPQKFFIEFIIKICYPLKIFGLNIDNLTSRIFLTFDYLDFYKNYSFKFSNISSVINNQINSKTPIPKSTKFEQVKPSINDFFWVTGFCSIFIIIQFL